MSNAFLIFIAQGKNSKCLLSSQVLGAPSRRKGSQLPVSGCGLYSKVCSQINNSSLCNVSWLNKTKQRQPKALGSEIRTINLMTQ